MTEKEKLTEAKAKILGIVQRVDWVSFVDVEREFRKVGIDPSGDVSICSAHDPNVVFWSGVSSCVSNAVNALLGNKKVFLHVGDQLSYFLDGGALKLPVARKPPGKGYKEPHWLPVFLRPVAQEGGRKLMSKCGS